MKHLFLSATLILSAFASSAQDFEVPQDLSLHTQDDYIAQETNVLAAIDWLMKTPFKEQQEKRQDVTDFILSWMKGTKAVSIGINSEIVTFMESSPNLLMIFMGAWIKYSLETKIVDDQVAGNTAGIEAVVDYYTKFMQSNAKDKRVEKYVKMKNEGTLGRFIEKNVKH